MPIHTAIDTKAGLVTHHIEVGLTQEEVVAAVSALFSHPDFVPSMDILCLVTPGATAGLSSVEISEAVAILRAMGDSRGTGRSAVVAAADADYGLLHVLSHLLRDSSREIQVFRDQEAALAWLGR